MLPHYLFIEPSTSMPGAGFILCTQPPFVLGKCYKFSSANELQDFRAKAIVTRGNDLSAQPTGFNILVVYYTQLDKKVKGIEQPVLQEMADFYLQEKILPHAKQVAKYRQA